MTDPNLQDRLSVHAQPAGVLINMWCDSSSYSDDRVLILTKFRVTTVDCSCSKCVKAAPDAEEILLIHPIASCQANAGCCKTQARLSQVWGTMRKQSKISLPLKIQQVQLRQPSTATVCLSFLINVADWLAEWLVGDWLTWWDALKSEV